MDSDDYLIKNRKGEWVKPPKPASFPISFKECLRRVVGGRLHGDRLYLFRKYWREISEGENDEGRLDKANAMIEKFTRERVNQDWFNFIAEGFPKWRKENARQQRINAAKKRWDKKPFGRRKKPRK